jgi:hypothetical protein
MVGNAVQQQRQPQTMVSNAVDAVKAQMQPQAPTQPGQFSYDPSTDPVYQKALAQAKANAQSASGDAMAALNKRGILDSTITSDRVAGIQQDAVANVEANVLPQLASQAYQRFQDDRTRADNLKYQDDQLDIQKGLLNGYYLPSEMQKQYEIVNQAKQDWANAKTPEERIAAHKRADAARAVITQLGGNAGLVGADVTGEQAGANQGKYGIETMAHQQQTWDQTHTENRDKVADKQWKDTFDYNDKVTMANLTGYLPDGTPTNAKQQQDLADLWTVADKTGVIPDKLADMYGIKHGTKTQAAYQFAKELSIDWYNSQTSRINANTNADQGDLAWIKADNEMSQPTDTKTVSPTAAGQILSQSLSKVVGTDPLTGKPVYGTITKWDTRKEAFRNAWNTSGVAPGPDTVEMLSKAGYTADEIAKLKEAYPQAFEVAQGK